jgi:tetratricopeptide (TPR) repeat protein
MIKNNLQAVKLKQLSETLSKVLETNSKKSYEESMDIINEAFRQLLGLNSDLVTMLPLQDIINFIGAYESAEVFKLIILADLLIAQGEVHNLKGNTALWLACSERGLHVYLKAFKTDKETVLEVSQKKLEEVIKIVNQYEMPKEISIDLIDYYNSCGSFDKAEDTFFELLESNDDNEEILAVGLDFYHRLLEKSQEELEAGNFSLEEVKDGLNQLKRLCHS